MLTLHFVCQQAHALLPSLRPGDTLAISVGHEIVVTAKVSAFMLANLMRAMRDGAVTPADPEHDPAAVDAALDSCLTGLLAHPERSPLRRAG